MKKIVWLIFLLLLCPTRGLVINELMYNPNQCSDFDCEWLELYNNDSVGINLTNWTISGNLIGNMFLLPNEYILIARELVDGADNDTESFEVAWGNGDGVWGNSPQENYNALQVSISLTNSDNTAINLTNGVEADLITYNLSMGGNGNGRTLCRYPDGYQTLVECVATPGMPNTLVTNVTNPTNVTSNNATCDLKLSISTGSDIYNAAETLNYDIIVNDTICANQSHSVVIEYSIEDLFGQLTSITPRNTTPQDIVCYKSIAKHWTSPNFTGSEAYMIKAKITDSGCNETNSENNNASQIVIVKGSQQDIGSAITITKVNVGSDNTVKFGESADVDLEVYRGDTNKYAIDVYVKDSSGNKISAVSTFHANSKFASYDLSIPVQIKTNCDGEFADSTYTVIAEGLDTYATASVSVAGVSSSTCKTITVSSSSSSSGGGSSGGSTSTATTLASNYEIISYNNSVVIGEEFSTRVKILNNFTTFKNFTVYSYVYKGNNPVSLGYDSNSSKWGAAYTANQVSLGIEPGSSTILDFKNMIEEGTELGTYNLRVRIKLDNKETDITKQIEIRAKTIAETIEQKQEQQTVSAINETKNETAPVKTITTVGSATGFVTARIPNHMLLFSPIAVLFNFFYSLLNH